MAAQSKKSAKNKRVVLGVTGSIAAYKSAELIRRLGEKGFDVTVIMTKEAKKFITPLTLASLSGKEVFSEMFDSDASSWTMSHIHLAKEASLVLVAPATANTIGKLASGMADDLLTTLVLATTAKIVIVPAMNSQMYNNKIVQDNCTKLKKFGITFIDPVKGKLACGDVGDGHIAAVDDIVKDVVRLTK